MGIKLFVKNFLREHSAAVILAFLAGLVIASPQIFMLFEPQYKGIAVTGTDSEEYYNGRVREIYDGHLSATSHDLYEYKNLPYVQPPLPEIVVAYTGKFLGLSANQIISFGKFLFPFLLFLVLYFFIVKATQNPLLSIAAPTAIILGSNFVFSPSLLFRFFSFHLAYFQNLSPYARPVHPEISSIVFFLWLFIFYIWFKTNKKAYYILSVLLLGSLFYVYLYSWMLAYIFLALLFILSFFARKKILHFPQASLFFLLLLSAIISIPYWINYFHLIQNPWYELLQKHYGFYKSHAPVWSNLLFLDFIALFLLYGKRKKDINFYIFLCIFLSLFIAINQQVITGIRFYPGHWHWYYVTPFSIIILLWFLGSYIEKIKNVYERIFFLCVIAISFFFGIVNHYNFYSINKDDYLRDQNYVDVFQWLDKNTKKDDVVLTHDSLNVYLPIYTHNNSYISMWGQLYLVPQERLYDMFFTEFYLDHINERNIDMVFNESNRSVRLLLFGYYKMRSGQCKDGRCISDEELSDLKKQYLNFYKEVNIENFLKKYKLDYAVWDPSKRPQWNLDAYKTFSFVKEIWGVRIYKVL